ncbi:MAG: hypothetical protein HYX45_03020 [Burkholderiales bacterium]|nr:hypothetical protein [Burkholderiales bacterium]
MSNNSVKALDAIRRLALKDLDATTDEELRAEVIEDGDDLAAIAQSVITELDVIISGAMREHTSAIKSRMPSVSSITTLRPAISRIKELIEGAFKADPQLATAFREGSRQSDADIESLYDDLVALGKIHPQGND